MTELAQQIHFCTSQDGTSIAYAVMGSGPPLVRPAHAFNHLEYDLESPVFGPWLAELARSNTLVRYDGRATGLSDRVPLDLSFDAAVADLEAVVDAAGLDRFALFGSSQGCPTSIAYAARHPLRVTRLGLYGGYVRGFQKRNLNSEQQREMRAMLELMEIGWGRENAAYRQIFTSQFIPDATSEQAGWFNELERRSATPEAMVRIVQSWGSMDVSEEASKVACPTLVMHARGDARVPFEEGRLLASLIPSARFLPLDGRNHVLLYGEPAFARMFGALHEFLGHRRETASTPPPEPALKQRLLAILAADAVGYSAHMARDARATLLALDAGRASFRASISAYQGRVIDMAGDSVLAVFETAGGAVAAAMSAQHAMANSVPTANGSLPLHFRIGVHLGDVIEKPDGTVYGDGVNVAARLQALAVPDGVLISDLVHGTLRTEVASAFVAAGTHRVKNIPRPIRAFSTHKLP